MPCLAYLISFPFGHPATSLDHANATFTQQPEQSFQNTNQSPFSAYNFPAIRTWFSDFLGFKSHLVKLTYTDAWGPQSVILMQYYLAKPK